MLHWLSEYLRGSNLEALSALAIGTGLLISRFLKGFREGKREKRERRQEKCGVSSAKEEISDAYEQRTDIEDIARQLSEIELALLKVDKNLLRLHRKITSEQKSMRVLMNSLLQKIES